jgi:hypothetical protein
MSAPETEIFDAVEVKQDKPAKPPREMSQAAIMSFFYGTLQLLLTAVGSVLVVLLMQGMKAFGSALSAPTDSKEGMDNSDLADVQKMIEELGITDPSLTQQGAPSSSGVPVGVGMPFESSPSHIMPMELLVILLTHGFGIFGVITAIISFSAIRKGKAGSGLAVTGLISSFLSFIIAFTVALAA